jgi:Right handed beta helix region
VIDGTNLTLAAQSGLVNANARSYLVLDSLEVRNSQRDGVVPYKANFLVIRNCRIHDNQFNGILAFNGSNTTIEDSEIYANSLDPANSYAGIRIDGNGRQQAGFLISGNHIHDNIGGQGWQGANGIYIGHTGSNIPTLTNVAIVGNDISHNGNPNQNQAGRGISGSFTGDVSVTGNSVWRNASAGIYLGDVGLVLTIDISQNFFYNNALRQFGGFTNGSAQATHNLVLVDDPNITGMGAEIGGTGPWTLVNNVFLFTTQTSDTYRGFVRINNPEQDRLLQSDYNTFYSAGPNRWLQSNDYKLSFAGWQAAGYDSHSVNPR